MQHPLEHDVWNARARLIAATLGLGGFLANFDVTSVVVVMPAIGTDLGIPVDGLAWIIDAYSIAFTATLLMAGALADRFGRRRTLMVGNVWFLVASLACGLAWNSPLFLAARAVQGGGAAFLVTGTFALIATAFPASGARVEQAHSVLVVDQNFHLVRPTTDILHIVCALRRLPIHGTRWRDGRFRSRLSVAAKT